jgi:uncharacterized protein (DUF488 family)
VGRLYTIGFTQKTAQRFFSLLSNAGVRRLMDTRLNNRSQLAGFSKADDLPYFLKALADIEYHHTVTLAPTQDMLDRFKKLKGAWAIYEEEFNRLLTSRDVVSDFTSDDLDGACLLCSEHTPEHCHRRLVAEHFARHFADLEIVHLT